MGTFFLPFLINSRDVCERLQPVPKMVIAQGGRFSHLKQKNEARRGGSSRYNQVLHYF